MKNQLIKQNVNEELTIDTVEVAEMMETKHYKILEKLEGTKDGKTKGIIPILADHDFVVSEYFIESTYKDGSGKENKCYLCTKLGCDFLANKFTGEKGILFTAKYVKRFNEMEKQIKSNELGISEKDRLLLGLFSNDKMVVAESHKQLVALEVKEATTPLLEKIEEDKPLVEFGNQVLKSADNILVRELSKLAFEQGMNIGEKKLYKKLREWKYIMQGSTEPYQSSINQGLFVVEEKTINTPYGTTKLTKTTKVTPKGQVFIIEKLRKEFSK